MHTTNNDFNDNLCIELPKPLLELDRDSIANFTVLDFLHEPVKNVLRAPFQALVVLGVILIDLSIDRLLGLAVAVVRGGTLDRH